MNIFHSVAEIAGNTPLLELCRYERRHGLNARILAKLECCNVAGTQWGCKKYMNMKHLEAALDDAFIAG